MLRLKSVFAFASVILVLDSPARDTGKTNR